MPSDRPEFMIRGVGDFEGPAIPKSLLYEGKSKSCGNDNYMAVISRTCNMNFLLCSLLFVCRFEFTVCCNTERQPDRK